MKTKFFLVLCLISFAAIAQAQDRFYTKSAKIDFYSKAPLEDIEAKNKSAVCVLDTKTGALQFSVLMKGFEFENEEMQEHYNENYVESDKYPKSEFKGAIINNSEIKYNTPGTYTAKVKGMLTLHGVTKPVETTGTIKVTGSGLQANSTFSLQPTDYNIKIPAIAKDKIAKSLKIVVDAKLDQLK